MYHQCRKLVYHHFYELNPLFPFSNLGPSASHVPKIDAGPGFVMNTVCLIALYDIRVQFDVETCQNLFVFWWTRFEIHFQHFDDLYNANTFFLHQELSSTAPSGDYSRTGGVVPVQIYECAVFCPAVVHINYEWYWQVHWIYITYLLFIMCLVFLVFRYMKKYVTCPFCGENISWYVAYLVNPAGYTRLHVLIWLFSVTVCTG